VSRRELPRLLLAGIGNPARGDDGVGAAVIAALRGKLPPAVSTLTDLRAPARLLAALKEVDAAWLVDAAVGAGEPGTLTRLDVAGAILSTSSSSHASSHGFGLAAALELARALGHLPARCVVYAVAAQEFGHGAGLSDPLRLAVPEIARQLLSEVDRELAPCRSLDHA